MFGTDHNENLEFGNPERLTSDSGPPFSVSEFVNLSRRLNFNHNRATPYWPEANGRAERGVRTLKTSLLCEQLENVNFVAQLNDFMRSCFVGK